MDQINTGKLIKTSTTMLLALRILFFLIILMAIVPWLAPTTAIGKFLLSMQGGFPSLIDRTHKNVDDFMTTLTLLSRASGFIASALSLTPLLLGTLIMLKLSKNYISGRVFNLENAKSYRQLGVIYLVSAILLQPLSDIFFSICVTINNPVGQRFIAFSINTINLTAIFFAIILIVIGQVMKYGQKISEEQELTV